MVKKVKTAIGNMPAIWKVIYGTAIATIVGLMITTFYGWLSDIESAQAAEEARAAICKTVNGVEIKIDELNEKIDENTQDDIEREKQTSTAISETNTRLSVIETKVSNSEDLLNKIWEKIDRED